MEGGDQNRLKPGLQNEELRAVGHEAEAVVAVEGVVNGKDGPGEEIDGGAVGFENGEGIWDELGGDGDGVAAEFRAGEGELLNGEAEGGGEGGEVGGRHREEKMKDER
jgi:hypothetical protein